VLKLRRKAPKSLVFEHFDADKVQSEELVLRDEQVDQHVRTCTSARFTMTGESTSGGRIMRIRRVDFSGIFLPL
jgi:hypothetical protein